MNNLSPFGSPRGAEAAYRSPEAIAEAQRSIMLRVYGWMTLGLGITTVAAFLTLSNERLLETVFTNMWVFFGLMIIELLLVLVLSARLMQLTVNGARLAFAAYAAPNGVTLSFLLLVYTGASVMQVFALTAGLFGIMALYG